MVDIYNGRRIITFRTSGLGCLEYMDIQNAIGIPLKYDAYVYSR